MSEREEYFAELEQKVLISCHPDASPEHRTSGVPADGIVDENLP